MLRREASTSWNAPGDRNTGDTMPTHEPNAQQPLEPSASPGGARRPWVKPEITELPRLTDLTLQTGDPIGGGGDTGGSTVF